MSKNHSLKISAFAEIGVRVGWVANLINCDVGFACISLPAVKKSKRSNLGQRCCQAKQAASFCCTFHPIARWSFYCTRNVHVQHVCVKIKESENILYPGVIWDLADIVKPGEEEGIDHDKDCINTHK